MPPFRHGLLVRHSVFSIVLQSFPKLPTGQSHTKSFPTCLQTPPKIIYKLFLWSNYYISIYLPFQHGWLKHKLSFSSSNLSHKIPLTPWKKIWLLNILFFSKFENITGEQWHRKSKSSCSQDPKRHVALLQVGRTTKI